MLKDIIKPSICEMGKIKIGGKKPEILRTKSGNEYRAPEKHDYFTITTMHRDQRGDLIPDKHLMETLSQKYGDQDGKLRQIPIALLSDDIEDALKSAYVWYLGKKVAARSDGVTLTKFADTKTGFALEEPEDVPWKPEYADLVRDGKKIFRQHTQLHCVIAAGESRWGGVYKFRTTSVISAAQLYGSLLHLKTLTGGILRGLPLMLVVRPIDVSPEGKKTTVYVVHVELRGTDLRSIQSQAVDMARFQLQHAQEMKSAQVEYKKLLCGPGEETDPVEAGDVAEEFHPENADADPNPPATPDPLLADVSGAVPTIPPTDSAEPREPVADCVPSGGEGENPTPPPVDNLKLDKLAVLDQNASNLGKVPKETLYSRCISSAGLLNEAELTMALHACALSKFDELDTCGPVVLRQFLRECVDAVKESLSA